MYTGVDFEVDEKGKPVTPVLVSPPFNSVWKTEGLVAIIGTEEETYPAAQPVSATPTALDAIITLPEQQWQILDNDEKFAKYCY